MRYLYYNSAGSSVEIGASNGADTVFYTDPDGRKASEVLLPKTDELMDGLSLSVAELDFIACVTGPGSFTGIRIGLVTARTLAQVTGKPILPVVYTRLLSFEIQETRAESLVTIVNGWGDMCYLGVYAPRTYEELLPPAALPYAAALQFIASIEEPFELIADAIAGQKLGRGRVYEPEACMRRLIVWDKNKAVAYQQVEPLYLLESQAERDLKRQA